MKRTKALAHLIALLSFVALLGAPASAVTVSPPVQVGTLTSTLLTEVSGIVGSHSMPNTLWVHNDRGDSARFFAINSQGTLLGQFPLAGATAVDWEDLAIGPKPGGGSYLYLGDIGDNSLQRTQISVFRLDEPQTSSGATIPAGAYTQAILQYPSGARNAESLLVDPISGELLIVTKSAVGQVYSAAANVFATPAVPHTMTALGNLNAPLFEPSAADISPDGLHILIRDRSTTAYLYERSVGQSVWDALQGAAIAVTLAAETQGEAIGWAADGSGFFTTSEWDNSGPQPLYFYAFAVPEPATLQLVICGFLVLAGALLARSQRG
ncbi:MAG: hypothetical protein AB7O59_08580 [Pirellulales bacterium]